MRYIPTLTFLFLAGITAARGIGAMSVVQLMFLVVLSTISLATALVLTNTENEMLIRAGWILLGLGVFILGGLRWYGEMVAVRPVVLNDGATMSTEMVVGVLDGPAVTPYRGYRWNGRILEVQRPLQDASALRGGTIEVYSTESPMPGDTVTVEGHLFLPWTARNPGSFDYRDYLLSQGVGYLVDAEVARPDERPWWTVSSTLMRLRLWVRDRLLTEVAGASGEEVASVICALVTGDRDAIPCLPPDRTSRVGRGAVRRGRSGRRGRRLAVAIAVHRPMI